MSSGPPSFPHDVLYTSNQSSSNNFFRDTVLLITQIPRNYSRISLIWTSPHETPRCLDGVSHHSFNYTSTKLLCALATTKEILTLAINKTKDSIHPGESHPDQMGESCECSLLELKLGSQTLVGRRNNHSN
jgi:hypothetical protein